MDNLKEDFNMSLDTATNEELELGLKLLSKKRETEAKIKAGILKGAKKVADMTDEEKEKYRASGRRASAKTSIILKKAKEANIVATEEEVEAWLVANAPTA